MSGILRKVISLLDERLGEEIKAFLDDPTVVEILLNPDGKVWIDTFEGRLLTDLTFDPIKAQTIISIVSGSVSEETHRHAPMIEAELPGSGYRFTGLLPPVVERPCFSIRKRAGQVFTLSEYVKSGILGQKEADYLKAAISNKANILISGGTGSGKTTLANAFLSEIAELGDRVITIEDTLELQCLSPDHVGMRTRGETVTMRDLIRSTLRMRPDRIIVGEVRGPEALDLIKAWNTGTPGGIATVHADTALKALMRLEQLISEISLSPQRYAIAETIDIVVQIKRTDSGRAVSEIIEIEGLNDSGEYQVAIIYQRREGLQT